MSELKLEVGKSYVNRVGDIVQIVSNDGAEPWYYIDSNDEDYKENGGWLNSKEYKLDLIEEYTEPTKPKDKPNLTPSFTIDGVTMDIKQKGNKTKLKFGNGYSYPGETAAVLTDTSNGYICKFKSHSSAAQDYYVCLDYSQASDLYLLLKTVLAETITEGENNE